MIIYLAVIAPDHDETTILGAFSALESAKAAFSEKGEWVRWPGHEQYDNEWWQMNKNPAFGFNDNEIRELTLDSPTFYASPVEADHGQRAACERGQG